MNILHLFRASTRSGRGLPFVAMSTPGQQDVASLVGTARRIYTQQIGEDLLVTAPSRTPGQEYSEHPRGLVLMQGRTLHAERLARLLHPGQAFSVEDALCWAGLDECVYATGRIGDRWYALEMHQNSENLTEIHLNTGEKRYTLLKQTREADATLWTLDTTFLHDRHRPDQESACFDEPPNPLNRPQATIFPGN